MSSGDPWLLLSAAVLVFVAGLFSSADAALASMSRIRAEELAAEGRRGSARLLTIAEDPPRYVNTALFLRMLCEITAIVLVTEVALGYFSDNTLGVLVSVAAMLVIQFVAIGVGPRTVGRLHAQRGRC